MPMRIETNTDCDVEVEILSNADGMQYHRPIMAILTLVLCNKEEICFIAHSI